MDDQYQDYITPSITTLQEYIDSYVDTEECNEKIIDDFTAETNKVPQLKAHRDYIEHQNKIKIIGHGDRCLHHMWKLIVDTLPKEFNFLEIGVYKGQILSLIQMLAEHAGKNPKIVGVTPLVDPSYVKYNRLPYIEQLYEQFSLTMSNTTILDGLSQDENIINQVYDLAPFDVVYVDGDHSYKATVADIKNFDKCLKIGGYLVVDDASIYKNMPSHKFSGIAEVSDAVRDTLEKDSRYVDLLTCMHVRIFRKVKEFKDDISDEDFWDEMW